LCKCGAGGGERPGVANLCTLLRRGRGGKRGPGRRGPCHHRPPEQRSGRAERRARRLPAAQIALVRGMADSIPSHVSERTRSDAGLTSHAQLGAQLDGSCRLVACQRIRGTGRSARSLLALQAGDRYARIRPPTNHCDPARPWHSIDRVCKRARQLALAAPDAALQRYTQYHFHAHVLLSALCGSRPRTPVTRLCAGACMRHKAPDPLRSARHGF
jgi:hypothetical protein